MSKALLVIDMPNECMECTLRYKDGDTDDWFRFRCHISDDQVQKGERLENCPLKPLGKKVEEYGLEIWDTKDGIFLCEKGLFDEMYREEKEND